MTLTIFTPSYNRAYILPKLFESLQNQSNCDFEWLIIDDGSTDNTKDLVGEFKQNAKFPIHYIYQENQGKHVAINLGVQKANGALFFIVDSDDYLSNDAISIMSDLFLKIKDDSFIAGIAVGYRSIKNGNKIIYSKDLPQHEILLTYNELYYQLKIKGDFATAFKTSVQKEFPYPVFSGEKFMRESIVYRRIGKKHKTLYVDYPLYFADYLDDGLTAKSWQILKQSPRGASLFFKELSLEKIPLKNQLIALNAYWDFQLNDIKPPIFEKFRGVSFWKSVLVLFIRKFKLQKKLGW